MTSPRNGRRVHTDPALPVVRTQTSLAAPKDTAPQKTAPEAGIDHPAPLDLAEETVRQHKESQARDLLVGAEFVMAGRVRHPDGGDHSVEGILQHEAAQRRQIDSEMEKGSRKHRRLPSWMRSIPKLVLFFDFCLLLYFFAGITNVDWASPVSLALAFATVLAAMVTVLSYGFLAFAGIRLRGHKNHAGSIHRSDTDRFTQAAGGIAVVVIAVVALLMFLRMRAEVLDALGGSAGITALVIAIAVAVVSVVANLLVIAVHALDGSDQTARLDSLSAAVRDHLATAHRMREKATRHTGR
jgi:uncharacterized membrane protein (DUF485 family)